MPLPLTAVPSAPPTCIPTSATAEPAPTWRAAETARTVSSSRAHPFAGLAGVVRGNLTRLQATAVSDRWGTTHYSVCL